MPAGKANVTMAWMMLWGLVGGTLVLLLVVSRIAVRRSRRLDRESRV